MWQRKFRNQQNGSAEGRRIGSKDRKTSKTLTVSGTQSSSVILHGDEKDFDRTQWEYTRLCEKVDNGEPIKKNVVVSKIKQEAPKVSSGSAVVTIQPPLCDTNPPKSTETIGRSSSYDDDEYEAVVMSAIYLLQSYVLLVVIVVLGLLIHNGRWIATNFTIVIGSLVLLAFLVVIFSFCFEIVQVCCKRESKRKKTAVMWRYRTITHVIKTLLTCASFVLLFEFEAEQDQRNFKAFVYTFFILFILLIAEHYAKCCLDWLKEKEEEKRQQPAETIDDDINMKK